jgi:hypothetical protein
LDEKYHYRIFLKILLENQNISPDLEYPSGKRALNGVSASNVESVFIAEYKKLPSHQRRAGAAAADG